MFREIVRIRRIVRIISGRINQHGSHVDRKTWRNEKTFSSRGKVGEFYQNGKVGEFYPKY